MTGCATVLAPSPLDGPQQAFHPACPPERYIVAEGSSPKGRSDAELQARAALARQLSSNVRVEVERMLEVRQVDGKTHVLKSLQQTFKEHSEFRHGELIRVIGSPRLHGHEIMVQACLERSQATGVLQRELSVPASRFEVHYQRALSSAKSGDWPAFTTAYLEASQQAPSVVALLAQVRLLSGGTLPDEDEFWHKQRTLAAAAEQINSQISFRIEVLPGGLATDAETTIKESLRRAISRILNKEVSIVRAGCRGSERGTYLLQMTPGASCEWGTLGHSCRLRISLTMTDCRANRRVAEISISDTSLVGTDTRDEQRALRNALQQLQPSLFEKHVREALASEIPLS